MPNTVLMGAQWGDEGKGKIIDVLTQDVDVEYLLLGCLFLQNGSPPCSRKGWKNPYSS